MRGMFEAAAARSCAAEHGSGHPSMHRTDAVDYIVLLKER